MELAAAQGVSFAVLGGFRAIAADLAWLKTYIAWEQRDAHATESLIHLATALDGRALSFWLNGARMMAYDVPVWRITDASWNGAISDVEKAQIAEVQARRALKFLQQGMAIHSHSAILWVERANIELNCLHDVAAAAESYRRASEQPRAPYFPARIHAELLRRLGRNTEALAWLVRLYPTLPHESEAAAANLVLSRIRELEHDLSIPPAERFFPPEISAVRPDGPLT
jgi:hypothetical protein